MSIQSDEGDVGRLLLNATSRLGAEQGIEKLGLREITAVVGRSTTAVFQHFGSKDGLLTASMEDAFDRDRAFHERLLATLATMPPDARALSATVVFYVSARARNEAAQLWLEALYKSRQFAGLRPLLARWHAVRRDFWAALLGSGREGLADLLAEYTAVEEAYAAALGDDPAYQLLLRETTDRLFSRPVSGQPRGAAAAWLEQCLPPLTPADEAPLSDTATRLLDQAVRVIVKRGAADLNLRRVAADAETAPSQIVYHFGDFAALRRQAIVAVLMRGLPAGLNPAEPIGQSVEATDWTGQLRAAVLPDAAGRPAGFYVHYARVLGQACLLAKRDDTLRPLMLQLRTIEGSGIFRLSQASWPTDLRLERDGAGAFAIWIKGRAILNEGLGRGADSSESDAIGLAAESLATPSLEQAL